MKNILVTGSSRGIGRATALALARQTEKVRLFVNYIKEEACARDVVAQIHAMGQDAVAVQADVSDPEQVASLFERIAEYGSLHQLVCNAGIAYGGRLFQDMTYAQWKRIFSVNVDGAFLCIQKALGPMLSAHRGEIVIISSIWGQVGASMEVDYSATKAALIGMTKALAKELSYSGLRVNAICPGAVDTDMLKPLPPAVLEEVVAQTPLGRLGTPEDIASAVVFLLSDRASFVTGQIFSPNGGFVIV